MTPQQDSLLGVIIRPLLGRAYDRAAVEGELLRRSSTLCMMPKSRLSIKRTSAVSQRVSPAITANATFAMIRVLDDGKL